MNNINYKKLVAFILIFVFFFSFFTINIDTGKTARKLDSSLNFFRTSEPIQDLDLKLDANFTGETFKGTCKIWNFSTSIFTNCTFLNQYIWIYNATTSFTNCTFAFAGPLNIYGATNITLTNSSLNLTSLHVYDTANLTVATCQLLVDAYLKINGTATAAFIGCPAINVSIDASSDSVSISSNATFTSSALHLNVDLSGDLATLLSIAGSAQFTHSNVTVDGVFNTDTMMSGIFGISGDAVFSNSAVTTFGLGVTGTVKFNETSTLNIADLPMYLDLFKFGSDGLHRFVLENNGVFTIDDSSVSCPASLLEVKDNSHLIFQNQAELAMNLPIQISQDAQMTVEGNSVLNIAEILVCNDSNSYYDTGSNGTGKLTINSSTVYGAIVDAGVNTTVMVYDSNVSTLGVYLFIDGANQVTIENNTITYNINTPWNKTITPTGDSTVNQTLFCIAALHTASVLVNASQIYGVLAGWNTNITLVNSTVSALVAGINNATITADNVTISGNGGATLEYGSVGNFNAYYISNGENSGNPLFTFLDSEIRGNILLLGGCSSTFTGCEFDLTYMNLNGTTSSAFQSCNFTLSNSLPAKPLHLHTTVNASFTNCTFWNMTSMDSSLYPATLENTGTYTFANCSFASAVLTITNTTTTTFHGRLDFVACEIAGALRLANQTTLVLQHSTNESIGYLTNTEEILIIERSGPELQFSGLFTNVSGLNEPVLSANLTVNNVTVPADPGDPLHFTLDPLTHQVPGPATFAITAYNTTGYSGLNFTRNITITIPSDAPQSSIRWDTTSEFEANSFTNCTIGTDNITIMEHWLTYDFTNDTDGADPANWTLSEPSGTSISVMNNNSGHNKVVYLDDESTSTYCSMYNNFTGQPNGSIEFWLWLPDVSDPFNIGLYDPTGATHAVVYSVSRTDGGTAGYLAVYYSGSWHDVLQLSDNAKYHIRLTFECGAGGYDNLSADQTNLYVNGTKYGSYAFASAVNGLGRLRFHTYNSPRSPCEAYIDAVDYSWSAGYFPNRSLEWYGWTDFAPAYWQSLIIDLGATAPWYANITLAYDTPAGTNVSLSYRMGYNTSTWVHWNGSAWEASWSTWAASNTTLVLLGRRYFQVKILLNTTTTAQYPTVHWIMVYYQSASLDLLWDTTEEFGDCADQTCTIASDQLTLQEQSIAYDFTADPEGSNPAEWETTEPEETTIYVTSSYSDQKANVHNNITFIDDNYPSRGDDPSKLNQSAESDGRGISGYCELYNLFANQSYGAVECWLLLPDVSCPFHITLYDSTYTLYVINFAISYDYGSSVPADMLGYHDGTSWQTITQLTDDTWYHLRVTFECRASGGFDNLSQYKFNLYLQNATYDMKYGPYNFSQDASHVGRFRFNTYDYPRQQSEAYIDAVDYSWAAGYFTNRSLIYYGQSMYAPLGLWTANPVDLDIPTPYYGNFTLSYTTPANTSVNFSYRMSADNSTWWHYNGSSWISNWSAWTSPNTSLQIYGLRYFQVRVQLTTTDPLQTPTVYSLNAKIYLF